jgi:Putative heavy-metal-binding
MSTGDVPTEAASRLEAATFTSGLTVPDFAACLHMGMQPVALVQGYCVMRWSWYGASSMYYPRSNSQQGRYGSRLKVYNCPHYYVSNEHRSWGENFEQPWVAQAWVSGYDSAFQRMLEEARDAGAHGIVGVVDTSSHLIDNAIREFHIYGTAVVIEGSKPPANIWTSYLAGQRLAKLIEAGFMPVSVVAAMASVRCWAVCSTEILMGGRWDSTGMVQPGEEIVQISDAQMDVRHLAREHIRSQLGTDVLHGAVLDVGWDDVSEGDFEFHATLRGTRVRRYKPADPLPRPMPTVTLR